MFSLGLVSNLLNVFGHVVEQYLIGNFECVSMCN